MRSPQQPTVSGALISTLGGSGSGAGLTATQPAAVERIAPSFATWHKKNRKVEEGRLKHMCVQMFFPASTRFNSWKKRGRHGLTVENDYPPQSRSGSLYLTELWFAPCARYRAGTREGATAHLGANYSIQDKYRRAVAVRAIGPVRGPDRVAESQRNLRVCKAVAASCLSRSRFALRHPAFL